MVKAKLKQKVLLLLIIYIIIGLIFGVEAFFEREGYASIGSRLIDATAAFLLWPILLIGRLACHGGNILRLFESCKYLPFGFS